MLLKEFELRFIPEYSATWWNNTNDIRYCSWWNNQYTFTNETRSIMAMVERFFPKFEGGKYWKISVECGENPKEINLSNCYEVLTPQVFFKYDDFYNMTDYQKKVTSLKLLKQGVNIVTNQLSWDIRPFEEAFNKVIENNYLNQWIWKKISNKFYIAEIEILHEVKEVVAFATFIDKKTKIILDKQVLFKDSSNEFSFIYKLGDLVWLSEYELQLKSRIDNTCWTAKLKA